MISNGEGWHYIVVKEITCTINKNNVKIPRLNCLHPFAAENKHESRKNVCENEDFCNIMRPSEDTKTLKFINTKDLIKNHYTDLNV